MNKLYDAPIVSLSSLEPVCKKVVENVGEAFRWYWDDRFEAILAQFNQKGITSLHKVLKEQFSTHWSHSSIQHAPSSILKISEVFGGLEPKQELFVSDPSQDLVLVVALWPWQDGEHVSLRISIWETQKEQFNFKTDLRNWFGLDSPKSM